MRGVAVMVMVVVMVAVGTEASSVRCKKHCPDPKKGVGHYVCCDEKPGSCPYRPVCPGLKVLGTPRYCLYDPECPHGQKCCHDACVGSKVCLVVDH
nr:crustin-like protein 4 [Eriocheir sinensis]